MSLFHITTRQAWQQAEQRGLYLTSSLDSEGFIHLSTESQWPRTVERFYRDQRDTLLLRIDPVRLFSEVRYEPADGELFPHLYGPLNLEAVVTITELRER